MDKMHFSYLVILLVLLSACIAPTQYDVVEIQEYEGERLDSVVSGFRENSIKGPQQVDISTYKLRVDGLVKEPGEYTYEEVLEKPSYSKVITLYCVEGWQAKILWTGIRLNDIFSDVEVLPEANTVKFYAVDGYTTTLPLAYIRDNNIMIAYEMNNATLIPARGFPFQLVAESKWGYKWIKWINRIELTDNPDEKGFWEQRGYNQDGNLSGPIFEG
jgi:DMSO/TMAO reductase YedYZ molybdopterin-dependent catalytic subunit